MFGYVTLGTNDLEKTAAFYDNLLAEIGAKRMIQSDRSVFWTAGPGVPMLGLMKPFDGKPASAGNGTMLALVVDATDKVDRVHQKALELGARDEGAPGPRDAVPGFYGAYFRDPDGNKLCVFNFKS
jgi:catechol 2,3-dioxygenase-like lactoylglutathione lyase family enzyme